MMSDYKDKLEIEVAFWRKVVNECHLDTNSSEYKRLQDALAFAEYRLEMLYAVHVDDNEKVH
ncbi:MAG: hypothetical protein EP297_10585 [Gammaproteobacteria bacterium]|nr:MAG: hypothetical protein EP297_10585 [Gammaproteobacteria bacterium]